MGIWPGADGVLPLAKVMSDPNSPPAIRDNPPWGPMDMLMTGILKPCSRAINVALRSVSTSWEFWGMIAILAMSAPESRAL